MKNRGRTTAHVLIEGNRFGPTVSASIQYCSSSNIVRRNVMWNCQYAGLDCCTYDDEDEATHNRANRFYNNTICGSGKVGASFHGGLDWGDQVFVNNIVYGNNFALFKEWDPNVQILLTDGEFPRMFHNLIIKKLPGERFSALERLMIGRTR
jgi:hypothetical protein